MHLVADGQPAGSNTNGKAYVTLPSVGPGLNRKPWTTRTTQLATSSLFVVFSTARTLVTEPLSWMVIDTRTRPARVGLLRSWVS
jgi:hypothetical protein